MVQKDLFIELISLTLDSVAN